MTKKNISPKGNQQDKVISLQDHRPAESSLRREQIQSALKRANDLLDKNESIELTRQLHKIEKALEKGEEVGLILPLCQIYAEMGAYEKADEWLAEALNRLIQQSEAASKDHDFQEEWLAYAHEMMMQGLLINHNTFVSEVYKKLKWTHFHTEHTHLAGVAAFNRQKYQQASRLWNNAFKNSQDPMFLQLQEVADMVASRSIPPFTTSFSSDMMINHLFMSELEQGAEPLEHLEELERGIITGGGKLPLLVAILDEKTAEEEKCASLALLVKNTGEWGKELADSLLNMNRFTETFKQFIETILHMEEDALDQPFPGSLPTSLPTHIPTPDDVDSFDELLSYMRDDQAFGFRLMEERERQHVIGKNLPKKLTFMRGLKNMPVEWLRHMCSTHGLDDNQKRADLEHQLKTYLLTPEHLLETLLLLEKDEWETLHYLLEHDACGEADLLQQRFGFMDDDGYYWFEGQGPVSVLGRLWLKGLLMVGSVTEKGDPETMVVIPMDIQETLTPLLPEAKKQRQKPTDGPDEALSLAYLRAATNLYGVVTPEKLTEIYNTHHEKTISPSHWRRYQYRRNDTFAWQKGHFVMDAVVMDDIFEIILQAQQGKEHYVPSKKEFLKYQDDEYVEKTKASQQLKNYLGRTFDIPKKALLEITDEIAFSAREADTPMELLEELSSFGVLLDDQGLIQDISGILVELINHSRKWENCGYTPNELYEKQHPYLAREPVEAKNVKVGRNEPCPCGSGKKYKRCCLNKETLT